MHFTKILLVCFGLVLLASVTMHRRASVAAATPTTQNGFAIADGGDPLPRPPLVADGGDPLPRPPGYIDGGDPLPRPPLTADGGDPLPRPPVAFLLA